jgi:hypothetical protein
VEDLMRAAIALACLASGLGLSGCISASTELSQEQACVFHNESDPVERDRCRQPANNRADTVPDVRPQELPVRTGQPSD